MTKKKAGALLRFNVVFFCPACRRRIVRSRDTPLPWKLRSFCERTGSDVVMRRSRNQTIGQTERIHV